MIGIPRVLILLILATVLALPASAAEDGIFTFIVGEEGLFSKMFDFFEDDYVQYFVALIFITFAVAALVQRALDSGYGPFDHMGDRQKKGIAIMFGIAVANGFFFMLRSLTIQQQSSLLWNGFFAIIGYILVITLPIWIYRALGEGN